MTMSSPASRTALVLVAAIVIATGIWIFWKSSANVNASKELDSKEQADHKSAQQGKSDLSESNPDINGSSQSESNEAQIDLAESKPTKADSEDFRVTGDDKYASVSKDRFFTTSSVTDLTPADALSTFRIGQRVYAYAAVHAPRKETVRITWFDSRNKEIPPSAYLDVIVNTGPVGYRVFSYRTFRVPGKYKVQLSNSVGSVIGEGTFKVVD